MQFHVVVNDVRQVPKILYVLAVYYLLVLLSNFKIYLSNASMYTDNEVLKIFI